MTPAGRLQVGDIVALSDKAVIVVAVGRSQCYSIVAVDQLGVVHLYTEVPFYLDNGRMVFTVRKPVNVRWAKEYARTHTLVDV